MLNRLQDVFKCLKEHKVKYLVIGGIAAVLYGVPRATFDLDILIQATPGNVRKLLGALLQVGLYTASMTSVDEVLATEVTVFKDRVQIDVQTSTPGLEFKRAFVPVAFFHLFSLSPCPPTPELTARGFTILVSDRH